LLGDTACNAVSLLGNAIIAPDQFTVEPDTVDFSTVTVGTIVDREVLVTNLSTGTIELNVQIQAPTYGFSLLQGGGPHTMYAGESYLVVLRFHCPTQQTYATGLFLGAGLPIVPVFAEGVIVLPDCGLSDLDLNFGTVAIGNSRYRYVGITNNTSSEMVLTPVSNSPVFVVSGDSAVIAPDSTATVSVRFIPDAVSVYDGTINLGPSACADISCFGEGTPAQAVDQDLLGIYFDTQYRENFAFAQSVGQVITGYLVLSNPSNTGGVSAWECRVELSGPALITGWVLAGQAIDMGIDPEFIVGLASPLPFIQDALLATFDCVLTGMDSDSEFSVLPIRNPSLPDQMAWIPGDLPDVLLPMRPVLGQPAVAFITASVLGVAAPTPMARLLGRQVDLSWPTPTVTNEGCHVYRRLEDEDPIRLTDKPLTTTGPLLRYTDAGGSLTAGATAYYSYAIMQNCPTGR